ncbi:hypothetical protein EIP86_002455 [Pleurotus ostreatoroseus]|nr:hypothetical protein EIP86_002455 [Pleurotus ostreatoroseus]
MSKVTIVKAHQPLAWYAIYTLASPRPRTRGGVIVVRKSRPADMRATELQKLGVDPPRAVFMRIDNVQHHLNGWKNRVGRENHVKIPISGFVAEAVDYDPATINMDDVRAQRKKNLRAQTIGALQWLLTLVKTVPQLASMTSIVAELYRTEGAKLASPCSPNKDLASCTLREERSRHNRATRRNQRLSLGRTKNAHQPRFPLFIAGDGMT